MSEDYRAKPEQWKLLQRQGQVLGSAESAAILELCARVKALERARPMLHIVSQPLSIMEILLGMCRSTMNYDMPEI